MAECRLAKDSEFDLVFDSLRHEDVGGGARGVGVFLGLGAATLDFFWAEAFEKKPRILCCLPVDDETLPALLFAVDGALAGVPAGALD